MPQNPTPSPAIGGMKPEQTPGNIQGGATEGLANLLPQKPIRPPKPSGK